MSNIIEVVEKMLQNQGKISDIEIKHSNKFNFSYKGYIWSIWQWTAQDEFMNTGISLAYYPFAENISDIKKQKDFIVYSSDEYISGESFKNLFTCVKEKSYNIGEVFDDILKD